MGMGQESADSGGGMLPGAVAAPKSASIELGKDASAPAGLTVAKVLAPTNGWLVVRSPVAPGGILGKAWVPQGLSRDVLVKLSAAEGADVRVALHVDGGVKREFEFDPLRPASSPDKPVVVEGRALEARVPLHGYGAEAVANSVLLLVEDQVVRNGTLTIRYLLLPTPGWISVNRIENGIPGKRVALAFRPAGESQEVRVPVGDAGPGEFAVTAFADRGRTGVFEFSPSDPLGSIDQPFKSAGVIVSQRIRTR